MDNFLLQSKKSQQGKVNILHSSFDPIHIQVNGERAISDAFCVITSLLPVDGIDYELASYIRLVSRLGRLNTGDWRIISLEAVYVRDRLVMAFPVASPSKPLILSEEVLAYPQSYRNLAFVMLHRGLKPRTGLPHEGDSDSVKGVLDSHKEWLENAAFSERGA